MSGEDVALVLLLWPVLIALTIGVLAGFGESLYQRDWFGSFFLGGLALIMLWGVILVPWKVAIYFIG